MTDNPIFLGEIFSLWRSILTQVSLGSVGSQKVGEAYFKVGSFPWKLENGNLAASACVYVFG